MHLNVIVRIDLSCEDRKKRVEVNHLLHCRDVDIHIMELGCFFNSRYIIKMIVQDSAMLR